MLKPVRHADDHDNSLIDESRVIKDSEHALDRIRFASVYRANDYQNANKLLDDGHVDATTHFACKEAVVDLARTTIPACIELDTLAAQAHYVESQHTSQLAERIRRQRN